MKHLFNIMLLMMACLLPSHAAADDDDHVRAHDLVASGKILPLETVLQHAFQNRPWRLLEAELEQKQGKYIYELEILDDQGKVLELKYDASTGKQLQHKDD